MAGWFLQLHYSGILLYLAQRPIHVKTADVLTVHACLHLHISLTANTITYDTNPILYYSTSCLRKCDIGPPIQKTPCQKTTYNIPKLFLYRKEVPMDEEGFQWMKRGLLLLPKAMTRARVLDKK